MNLPPSRKEFLAIIIASSFVLFIFLTNINTLRYSNYEYAQPTPDYHCKDCNIVLISIDALRADHLGAYGYQRNTSPSIDRFATAALLFENSFAQAH